MSNHHRPGGRDRYVQPSLFSAPGIAEVLAWREPLCPDCGKSHIRPDGRLPVCWVDGRPPKARGRRRR